MTGLLIDTMLFVTDRLRSAVLTLLAISLLRIVLG